MHKLMPMAMCLSAAMFFFLLTRVASKVDVLSSSVVMNNLRGMATLSRHDNHAKTSSYIPICCFALSTMTYPSTTFHYPSRTSTHRLAGDSRTASTSTSISMSTSRPSNTWGEITNCKTSKTVKLFKSVHRANKSKRSELGLTVAEGVRLVSDILSNDQSRHLVRRIVVSESLLHDDTSRDNNADQYQQRLRHWLHIVDDESRQRNAQSTPSGTGTSDSIASCSINVGTDDVVAECSGTVTSQGVVALVEIPPPFDPTLDFTPTTDDVDMAARKSHPPFYLILDGLSDPGNVGSLLRACAASYVSAMILLPGSCDVWNPKTVRSSMGASFRVPILEISKSDESMDPFEQLLDVLQSCSVDSHRVYAATMEESGENASLAHYDVDFTRRGGAAAVILGTEGEGLRSNVRNAIKRGKISTIHVPMSPGMESLNAAVCGGIIMFERMRQLSITEEAESR